MKIVEYSKGSITEVENVFKVVESGAQGPQGEPGTIGTLDLLDPKVTPVNADLMLVGDSADSFANKSTTWANIKATLLVYFTTAFNLLYSKISGTTALGLITTSATIDSGVNSEYTGNIVADVTLNATLTPSYPTVKVMLDLLTDTTDLTVTILSAGNTVIFPINQTQTLTDLPDGYYEIILSLNVTKSVVVSRVQRVS